MGLQVWRVNLVSNDVSLTALWLCVFVRIKLLIFDMVSLIIQVRLESLIFDLK